MTDQTSSLPKVTWLAHIHLTTYCRQLHDSRQIHRPQTEFEQLCSLQETPRHTLSLLYKMILDHTHSSLPRFTAAWSGDLGKEISEAEWQKAFFYIHKSSVSSYAREKNYKVLSRWYRVPTTLRIMFPSAPDSCWRCNSAIGTYRHIWWDCEVIRPFWNQIFQIYSDLYDKPLLPSPTIALLSILLGTFKFQKHTLLRFSLSTSRQLISRHWNPPHPHP